MTQRILFYVILSAFWAAALPLAAQTVSNVRVEQQNTTVTIYYNLQAAEKQWVEIFLSEDGGRSFEKEPIKTLIGDVGIVQPGTNKKATWNVLRDRQILYGNNFVFRVKAENMPQKITDPTTGMTFALIPGGTFQMCSNDGGSDEKPIHTVTVSDFYMGTTEVTQAQWKAIMGNNPSRFKNCDNCPVENVSWYDVQEFIEKLNRKTGKTYRLPTEAEWEYAARGGENYKYAGSNNIGSVAWYSSNSDSKTHPVGQKQPNGYGLYDMSGNVWEWCADWYDSDYYKNSPQKDPVNTAKASGRVRRGGSWISDAGNCRVANRSYYIPTFRISFLGFRLVLLL